MRIACWNVNSIRSRRERFSRWLDKHQPDVLCLQELKALDGDFPLEVVRERGYHAAIFGQKTYNGVAIVSKAPIENIQRGMNDGVDDPQSRLVSGMIGGIRVICVYVPNGSEPTSEKFTYKLAWLQRLKQFLASTHSPDEPLVLCGDFNIAPDDRDVCDVAKWAPTVLCHPDVRARLADILSWGLTDTFRLFNQEAGHYSWWDYRGGGFPKNHGLRIDLVLATKSIVTRCTEGGIDRDERKGIEPSDHAPVFVSLT